MSLVVILLTYIAVSFGLVAIIGAIGWSATVRREREEAELNARLRAQVERIIASM